MKLVLKADHKRGVPLKQFLVNSLLHYRITPHVTTGVASCTLTMNHGLRTHLDLLKPNIAGNVHNKQADQKQYSDNRRHMRVFSVDQEVMVRNFREGDQWISGKIIDQLGPVSYLVQCSDGSMWRRHVDHILEKTMSPELAKEPQTSHESPVSGEDHSDSVNDATFQDSTTEVTATDGQSDSSTETASNTETVEVATSRYPKRATRPPERYM